MVAVHRPEPGDRHVVWTAEDNGRASLRKLDHQIIGIGQSMCMREKDADIVEWYTPHFLTFRRDGQKATRDGEVPVIRSDLDHPTAPRRSSDRGLMGCCFAKGPRFNSGVRGDPRSLLGRPLGANLAELGGVLKDSARSGALKALNRDLG